MKNLKWVAVFCFAFAVGCASKSHKAQPTSGTDNSVSATADHAAKAMHESAEHVKGVTCSRKGDHRLIRVQPKMKGCEVLYKKFGKESSIASSSRGMKHCNSVVKKIQGNLQKAGFKCEE